MKHILAYVFLVVAFFSFIAFMAIDTAKAHEYKKVTQVTNINLTSDKVISDVMSVAGIDCSSSKEYQLGVGLGTYGDSTSIALGTCNRFDNVLLKITGHERGGNIGIMFTFN